MCMGWNFRIPEAVITCRLHSNCAMARYGLQHVGCRWFLRLLEGRLASGRSRAAQFPQAVALLLADGHAGLELVHAVGDIIPRVQPLDWKKPQPIADPLLHREPSSRRPRQCTVSNSDRLARPRDRFGG